MKVLTNLENVVPELNELGQDTTIHTNLTASNSAYIVIRYYFNVLWGFFSRGNNGLLWQDTEIFLQGLLADKAARPPELLRDIRHSLPDWVS